MGWKRWVLVVACLFLAGLRIRYPDAKVDAITVWLLGLASALFVLPELVPYVEQLKVGAAEIKLRQSIGKVADEVAGAQRQLEGSPKLQLPESGSDEVQKVIEEAAKDPGAALLLLSTRLEDAARRRVKRVAPEEARRVYGLPKLVEVGVSKGLFPESTLRPVRDFWGIRNQVAHGGSYGLDRATVMSVLAIGVDLWKLLSAEPGP